MKRWLTSMIAMGFSVAACAVAGSSPVSRSSGDTAEVVPAANVDVTYGPEGWTVTQDGFDRAEGAEGPVRVRVSAPGVAEDFEVLADNMGEAFEMLLDRAETARGRLEGSVPATRPFVTREDIEALPPGERAEVARLAALVRTALEAMPTTEALRAMSPEERRAAVARVQTILRERSK